MEVRKRKSVIILSIVIIGSIVLLGIYFWPHSSGTTWYTTNPIFSSDEDDSTSTVAVKDPSIVFYNGSWHMFYTSIFINEDGIYERTINYVSSERLEKINEEPRYQIKPFSKGTERTAAPCVFYFEPQNKWYLVAQALYEDPYTPVYSTTYNISDPNSWSDVKTLVEKSGTDKWIDFWIICDDKDAYLFYTSAHSSIHYMKTDIDNFPKGFGDPVKSEGDILVHEACMVYSIPSMKEYWLITEVQYQGDNREFYISRSDSLDGTWSSSILLATGNDLKFEEDPWSSVVSHGEFIRKGYNQNMELPSSTKIEFVFQGVQSMSLDYDKNQWQLGITRNFKNEKDGSIYKNES